MFCLYFIPVLLNILLCASGYSARTWTCRWTDNNRRFATECYGGDWPATDEELNYWIPPHTTNLTLRHVYFNGTNLPVLPPLPNITELHLENLLIKETAQVFSSSQFWSFVESVNRTRISSLTIKSTDLQSLGETTLNGFNSLTTLRLLNCGLFHIHPLSLRPIVTDVNSNVAASRLTLTLTLEVGSDSKLTSFPWDVLRPVSEILLNLKISDNSQLRSVSMSGSLVAPFILTDLHGLEVLNNPKLTSFPEDVSLTLYNKRSGIIYGLRVEFERNGNKCGARLANSISLPPGTPLGSCELMPLIRWSRAGETTSARRLAVTCAARAHLDRSGYTGYWRGHEEPDCEEVSSTTTTTTTRKTTPTTTTPRSTTHNSSSRFTPFWASSALLWIVLKH